MRKRDLVHLHTLLSLVRRWLAERGEEPPGAYDAYERLDLAPTGLDRRKREHREAVHALLDGIEATVASTDARDDDPVLDDWDPTGDASRSTQNARR